MQIFFPFTDIPMYDRDYKSVKFCALGSWCNHWFWFFFWFLFVLLILALESVSYHVIHRRKANVYLLPFFHSYFFVKAWWQHILNLAIVKCCVLGQYQCAVYSHIRCDQQYLSSGQCQLLHSGTPAYLVPVLWKNIHKT